MIDTVSGPVKTRIDPSDEKAFGALAKIVILPGITQIIDLTAEICQRHPRRRPTTCEDLEENERVARPELPL